VVDDVKEIQPSKVQYIKLGSKGDWEDECIKTTQTIRIGFREVDHSTCLAGKWDDVRKTYEQLTTPGKATEYANQIRTFYESDALTLWVTFHENQMWWCFADEKITQLPDGSKTRNAIEQWRGADIFEKSLTLDSLSGKLTQVRGFRGTICQIKEHKYAVDRINGRQSPMLTAALEAKQSLQESLLPLIQNLTWGDFEILVDLVFAQSGWQRVGVLGKTEKDWDLDLIAPVTGERALVQVKSRSDAKEFRKYVDEFRQLKEHNRLFFIAHSMSGGSPSDEPSVRFIGPEQLAELVVNAGLSAWLIKKNS
jgi:hypothetical protein